MRRSPWMVGSLDQAALAYQRTGRFLTGSNHPLELGSVLYGGSFRVMREVSREEFNEWFDATGLAGKVDPSWCNRFYELMGD